MTRRHFPTFVRYWLRLSADDQQTYTNSAATLEEAARLAVLDLDYYRRQRGLSPFLVKAERLCDSCQGEGTVWSKHWIGDVRPRITCPACGGTKLSRVGVLADMALAIISMPPPPIDT